MNDLPDSVFRQIFEGAGDAVILAGGDGIIRFWNRGATAIFGHEASEAIGQTLDLIIPEKQRQRHWEGYDRVLAAGETKYGTSLLSVPATRKDGTRISVEFTIAVVRDSDGAIVGLAAIMRDVTARWEEMRALRAKAAGGG